MTNFWYAVGDFLQWTLGIYDVIGNKFNYLVIIFGFIGLFYWLNRQRGYNEEAKNNPDQIK